MPARPEPGPTGLLGNALLFPAVFLSGLGGLLAELVWVRRFGLLLGNTSEASSLVIGCYLLGLGVGGLLVPAVGRRLPRALHAAAAAYLLVALAVAGLDALLRNLAPLPLLGGFGLLILVPGLPTLLMGVGFPLVFGGLPAGGHRLQVGGLVAANLFGSLLGTALGANLWLPELGFAAGSWIAAAAYVGAAALLLAAARGIGSAAAAPASAFRTLALPGLAPLAVAAAVAGALVVGLQLLLLRRLPFFLEGFQPTLSGVLGGVLLALGLGSALGPSLLTRAFGARALAAALALAGVSISLGLHEHAVPWIARQAVRTELALHARIWEAALVSAAPACFFLGAVVPLGVSRYADPVLRSVAAGRLFFWQGVGSLAGSLVVGHLLPPLWPHGFFVLVPLLLGLAAFLAVAGRLRPVLVAAGLVGVLAASLLGVSGAGTLLAPEPPLLGPHPEWRRFLRHLDHRSDAVVTASVSYDRSRHSMVLFTNEFRATETGPFADYMKVLGHLPFLLRDELRDVAVIAFGTGTTARSVVTWPEPSEIHLVEISQAVIDLAGHFAGDGPLPAPRSPAFLEDPRTRVHVTDGRRFLALRPEASLDLVTIEPLLPYAPGTAFLYTREFYELVARALRPGGLMVQWVPTHALPPDYFGTLCASFAHGFPHTSAWFVDGATLLVGSDEPHLPDPAWIDARFATAPDAARVALHEAGLASSRDVRAAFVSTQLEAVFGSYPDLHDDRPFVERVGVWKYDGSTAFFHRPNYNLLIQLATLGGIGGFAGDAWSELRANRIAAYYYLREATIGQQPLSSAREAARRMALARQVEPNSVLLYAEETLALRFFRAHEMAFVGAEAGDLARQQLARDSGSAIFQAARALPGASPGAPLDGTQAAALAVAIDPTFFLDPPRYVAHLPRPDSLRSPLEAIGTVPRGAALAEAVTGDDPLAVALRAAYRVRSARALIGVLAERPLRAEESRALAPLLDPELLVLAAEAVRSRGGSPHVELQPIARPDLPAPAG